ncbi:MAG: hypothetical protein LBS91_07505 [Clostridiales Family XIII bacterium]|jgi:virulence-associated protein VapD|nr:hypothetical protein [Clostridiales Family XIII bacterium]
MANTANQRRYKAINFDLDTNKLNGVFGENKYRKGYSLVRKYLESHGFEHRQWSGYRSLTALSTINSIDVLDDLMVELPWLIDCAHKIDVTNIGREFDMLQVLKDKRAEDIPETQVEIDPCDVSAN